MVEEQLWEVQVEGIGCRIGVSFDDDEERVGMLFAGMLSSLWLLLWLLLNGRNDGGKWPCSVGEEGEGCNILTAGIF